MKSLRNIRALGFLGILLAVMFGLGGMIYLLMAWSGRSEEVEMAKVGWGIMASNGLLILVFISILLVSRR